MSKGKKTLIIVFTSIMGTLFVVIFVFAVLFCIFAFRTTERRDIDDYLKTDGKISNFIVFPRYTDNIQIINDYYYIDYNLKDGCIVVLDATYDEVAFDNEIERIKNIMCRNWLYSDQNPSDYGKYKKLLYCEDNVLFHLPTFVAVYNDSCEYEYVCVDYDNKRCIYVFIDSLSFEKIILDEKYIPINYQINISREGNDGNRYNVYPRYPDVKYDEWYTNKNDLS